MNYIVIFFILLSAGYALSFAKYEWKKQNKCSAVGVTLLIGISIILPIVVMVLNS
jgi:hypothetical protein